MHLTLPSCPSNVISHLGPILPSMWRVWECITLGEPILVFGPTPDVVSGVVWWLREIARPVVVQKSGGQQCIDAFVQIFFDTNFRPCFTLQDQDYATLISKRPPKEGIILGITNPLVQKTCCNWPHIIDIR